MRSEDSPDTGPFRIYTQLRVRNFVQTYIKSVKKPKLPVKRRADVNGVRVHARQLIVGFMRVAQTVELQRQPLATLTQASNGSDGLSATSGSDLGTLGLLTAFCMPCRTNGLSWQSCSWPLSTDVTLQLLPWTDQGSPLSRSFLRCCAFTPRAYTRASNLLYQLHCGEGPNNGGPVYLGSNGSGSRVDSLTVQ